MSDGKMSPVEPGSPNATTTISGKQLPPPDLAFGGVIAEKATESKAWWPPRVVPGPGAPNVLLIMTDDVGFGAPSTFGGVVPDACNGPHREKRDCVTQISIPRRCAHLSRAALITGRNHHVAGFGVIGEIATGIPGYDSIIRKENGTIGTILKENGYATSWFGKESQYTLLSGEPRPDPSISGRTAWASSTSTDSWVETPASGSLTCFVIRQPFTRLRGIPEWNLTTAMADEAIQYMADIKEVAQEKPFLVYYVPGGTHAPHHPTPEWIKKISEMHLFDEG